MKVKVNEVLSAYPSLKKISNNDSYSISLQFKFKLALLIKDLEICIIQYQTQLNRLMKEYNTTIEEGNFIDRETKERPNNKFFLELSKIEDSDLDIEYEKIKIDKHINGVSANDLLILMPFFDYDEIIESIK